MQKLVWTGFAKTGSAGCGDTEGGTGDPPFTPSFHGSTPRAAWRWARADRYIADRSPDTLGFEGLQDDPPTAAGVAHVEGTLERDSQPRSEGRSHIVNSQGCWRGGAG